MPGCTSILLPGPDCARTTSTPTPAQRSASASQGVKIQIKGSEGSEGSEHPEMSLSRNPHRRRQQLAIRIGLVLCVLLLWRWVSSRDEASAKQEVHRPRKLELAKDRIDSFADGRESNDDDEDENENENENDATPETQKGVVDWADRRERVRDAFLVSWEAYAQDAWGHDIYHPRSRRGEDMIKDGMGWIIVDALDTMMIMNLSTPVQYARNWIHSSLQYDTDHDVNTFETTIRMLGGLLSAHYLSTTYPDLAPITEDDAGAPGEDLYIEKATDLADRLLGAFESGSGVPYASINLNTSQGIPSHNDGGSSSTAEATSVQLEFKYLAKLTGETNYWETVERVMQVVERNGAEGGLVPIFIQASTGNFYRNNIRLGSRGDSYYEYLIKQYLQTNKEEPIYLDMWEEALAGIRKYLVTYTKKASLTIVGERPLGLDGDLSPKMDHLVCFLPGTIALGATGGLPISKARQQPDWSNKQEEEILLARELMKTCWATYLATETGLAGEITYFEIDDPPRMERDVLPQHLKKYGRKTPQSRSTSTGELPLISKPFTDPAWRDDLFIKQLDRHNLQRPETVESLFYMYRIMEDDTYRHWGWEMFRSFIKHTAVTEQVTIPDPADGRRVKTVDRIYAFTSLNDVKSVPAQQRDNMESFWLAETLKYFYLLFSDRDFLPLEETVFNTEAHVFPRFGLGKLFKTGWEREFPGWRSKD